MTPINVTFPLKGLWQVVTSPANHVPSHYTEMLGMTYAFDFAKRADTKIPFFKTLKGYSVQQCQGWEQEIICPADGKVVALHNNEMDRKKSI